ncbi:MAG: glycosyltransferase family 4 protein [Candidatus Methylacidiphilales bacterium]|nr:glycosyltransferase family 4 protein [Candidatus Methylacidiphilales bacterium]
MRIAFVRRNWSPTGGAENYLKRLAGSLSQAGHECHLLCESWDDEARDMFRLVERFPVDSSTAMKPRRFADAVNVRLGSVGEIGFHVVFSLERGVRAHIYRAGDGVHREWLRRRQAARPLTGFFRNRFNPKNRVVCALERVTFHPKNTRRVIANSEMVRSDILRHFDYPAERIRLVRNGVDHARFGGGDRAAGRRAMEWDDEEYVVLLVGAGAERKGHVQAQEAARRAGADVRMVIIDSPPPCPLPDLYAAADVFLLPTWYDPFANVTLEALAAGLPVITTTANGGSEIIQNGREGFVVGQAGDVRETAHLIRLLRDESLRLQMGRAARKTAATHTQERNVRETLDVIHEVASAKG